MLKKHLQNLPLYMPIFAYTELIRIGKVKECKKHINNSTFNGIAFYEHGILEKIKNRILILLAYIKFFSRIIIKWIK